MAEETPTPELGENDGWHKFTESLRKLLDYERWAVILPVVACGVALAVIMVGCQPTSTINGERVTPGTIDVVYEAKATELEQRHAAWIAEGSKIQIDAASLDKSYETAFADMQAQAEKTNAILEAIGGIATGAIAGTINPAGIIGTLVTLGAGFTAIGVGVSSRRKNTVIDRLKTGTGTGA